MEMAGVDAQTMAGCVQDCLGGRIDHGSAFVSHVRDTELGDFRIELDAEVLKSRAYTDYLARLGIDIAPGETRDQLESVLSRIAGLVVPLELVCPPVELDALQALDRLRAALRDAGARGTQSSALYAFGLQLNLEVHDPAADALLAVLRAFFLRFEDLRAESKVDFSRKLTPYVQPFPADYIAHVLDPDYQPDQARLIDDYLHFTPTRNRPLDLLPLFAWLDGDRVGAAAVEHELIKPRPTWHYRLPNCLIDEADWDLSVPFNGWVAVEALAADPDRIRQLTRQRPDQRLRRWLAGLWRQLRRSSRAPDSGD